MKRIPVTQASYKKIDPPKSPKGVAGASVKVGKPDKNKYKEASYLGWGSFGGNLFGRPNMIGASSTFYNNSYMNGGRSGGMGDVPPWIALMNEQNGGVLYYPATLKEKYEFYRYFYRSDPYVKAAVDLNTDLPMSRLQLRMPKMRDKRMSKRIEMFYQTMIDDIHLFDKLHSILFEQNIIGNAYLFVEYSEEKKRWGKLTILPPEEVNVANYPLSDVKRVQYRPEMLKNTIMKYDMPLDSYDDYREYVESLPDDERNILRDVSYEFVKQMRENNGILTFDTDPYQGDGDDKIGSFVYHFANKRHEYQDLGVSPLECILQSLLQKTHYMFTQLSLASRNMTPRDLIVAEGITPEALEELRDQVDQSMLSPDYKIVTNYQVQWEQIGADNRLIDLQRENEVIENQLFAGLGVTRELLTGEGMYSGNKISIEILNTKYLLVRETLQKFVEEALFKPVALQNGFYHDDDDGNRTWFYPRIGFTRLTIRDNQEVFDQLFQLYQKGSVPIGMILDIFNINSDDVDEELKKDLFTVKDATFNEMLRQAYSSLGDKLAENTDLIKQIAESITGPAGKKLKYSGEDADDEMGGDSDEGFGMDEEDMTGDGSDDESTDENELFNEESGESSDEEESENSSVNEYIHNIINEHSGDSDSSVDDYLNDIIDRKKNKLNDKGNSVHNWDVNDYIDRVTDSDSSAEKYINGIILDGNAEKYIEKVTGDKRAVDYVDRITGAGNAKKYVDRITGNGVSEYIDSVVGGGNKKSDVSDYLSRVIKEKSTDDDSEEIKDGISSEDNENIEKDSFFGEEYSDNDWEDEAQSAGLSDDFMKEKK